MYPLSLSPQPAGDDNSVETSPLIVSSAVPTNPAGLAPKIIIPGAAPDPLAGSLDLARFRRPQNYAELVPTTKLLTQIPVRKPSKEWWVRTHPNPEFHLETQVIELKEDSEIYLVDAGLCAALADEPTLRVKLLVPAINRQGVLFLWHINLPGPDGKTNSWNESALRAANHAAARWIRVTANITLGAYEMIENQGQVPEPEFPNLPLSEIIEVAFRGMTISTLDHPVLRKLRGEL